MEMLLVVAHHRNQYSRRRNHGPARLGSFGSPPSRVFGDINCRTFQSDAGILPTPPKSRTTPATKQPFSPAPSPKTPLSSVNSHSENNNHLKTSVKSSVIPIPINIKGDSDKEGSFNDELSYSELWAGPAYSNSPPPSSLPIPKFSFRPKRTVSLDFPASGSGINLHPIAKSAPPSPTRDHSHSPRNRFHSPDNATKTLRRILNLDMTDE